MILIINAEFWVLYCIRCPVQGEKDWQKYETARKLKLRVDAIRHEYQMAWTAREMKQRQRGVALYFIDKVDYIIAQHDDEKKGSSEKS